MLYEVITHPEVSFNENDTSIYVQNQLKEMGISFTAGFVKTGILGVIKGKNPEKRTIALT